VTRFIGSITGVVEARAATSRIRSALQQDGALGKAVASVTLVASRFAAQRTPVATGTWRAAHRAVVQGLRGRVFLDPNAVSPTGGRPSEYGSSLEQTRGGRYAVYKQTIEEAGPAILREAGRVLEEGLP
jgi:hypothetical protein